MFGHGVDIKHSVDTHKLLYKVESKHTNVKLSLFFGIHRNKSGKKDIDC